MRSFFLFILRHYAIFMFLFLEFISFYLIFTHNSYHQTYFINTANTLTGNVLNSYGNFQEYFSLREVNDSLMEENALLREQLLLNQITDTTTHTVSDTTGKPLYTYVPAEVIGLTITEANNYITLNKGTNDGINIDMGVITSNGIVGRVVKVSPNFSVVMSVLHTQFVSHVAVKKSNAQGSIKWDGKNPTEIEVVQVPEPGAIKKGDSIVTSRSEIFPPDIFVGTLQEIGKDPGSNFYTLQVKLSTNFSTLKYVYVVNELMSKERKSLENQVQDAGY